ncbi:MAG TPA: EAL domain-containing protein [Longimicrobium sp.]
MQNSAVQAIARRYLKVARNALAMDVVWLAERTGSDQILHAVDGDPGPFGISEGSVIPWPISYCSRALDGTLPSVIPDARAHPDAAALAITERLGIGSYASAPVHLPDGTLFGMVCCLGRGANPQLGPGDGRLLDALAASLGEDLARAAIPRPARISRGDVERAIAGQGVATVLQPIVGLADMRMVGAEALTRFEGPGGSPDVWFARAAELGLGVELEIATILSALALLPAIPAEVYLSVNVSPGTVSSPALREALAAVDARRVVLEITEHSSVTHYDELVRDLDELRGLGARVAVDDAGAGYASFRHILALRPHTIKLDRDMVCGIDEDRAREVLVGALASFADSLGATVVAEGVETAGELDTLVRLGITCGQGYYLARPAPLPLPGIVVSPTPQRLAHPRAAPRVEDFAGYVRALLADVAAATGLETSFLNIRNLADDTLEHRYVHDPAGMGVPAGHAISWTGSLCQRCREAGLVWTADVSRDLPGAAEEDAEKFGTFVSVPVLGAGGEEVIGTLCAAGRSRRYLSDRTIVEVERISRGISDFLVRRGIKLHDGSVTAAGG